VSEPPGTLPPLQDLLRIFREIETIAVVGASSDESKPSHRIPRSLQAAGYRIVPVTPGAGPILGVEPVRSLHDLPGRVDAVDVFRPAAEAPAIARDAVAVGARLLWLQLGIVSEEARRIGEAAGLTVVMNACMGAVHRKLARRHGLSTGG
jgi:predicted CoA-binding protein